MSQPDTLYIVDMDRCTLDTDAAMHHLASVLESFGLDHITAEAERRTVMQKGDYVEVWTHLVTDIFPRYDLDEATVEAAYMDGSPDRSLLYPGVPELFDHLSNVFVMTFGGQKWQAMKAKRSGIIEFAPVLVVDTHEKGRLIADARQPDGGYSFQLNGRVITGKSVVLVDDKASAFIGLPDDCRGYQINSGKWFPFQEGTLPSNATLLPDFTAFIEKENL